jgi:outer membrane protein assembly factor BamA
MLLLGSLVVAAPGVSAGQQTKAADAAEPDDAAAQRQREGERTEPGIRAWIKRRLSSSSEGPKDGVSMTGGIIVAGSGLAAGAGYRKLELGHTGVGFEVKGIVSVRRYQEYRFAIGGIGAKSSTLELDVADASVPSLFNDDSRKGPGTALYADVRYRNYPRHTHFGVGLLSRETDKSDFALTGTSIEGVWQRQFNTTIGVSVRGGLLDLDVGRGRNDSILNFEERFPITVPGAVLQPRFLTVGAGLAYDRRSQPALPEDGTLLGVAVRRFAANDAPELSFTRMTLDMRAYQRLLSPRGVLAVRSLVSTDFTGERGSTPFYLLPSLGGGETLRGFHSYRFEDRSLAHVTAEYRWRAHRYVEIAPFVDAGTMAPAISRLSLGAIETSVGVGFRARTDQRSLGRLDVAWGAEGYRFVLGTGPVF